jgi:uncharacterized protein (TIGR02118 family)
MSNLPQVIVTVLYPRHGMSSFDMEYYINRHIPVAKNIWGPFGMTNLIVSEAEKNSDYAVQATMMWRDMDAWKASQEAESNQKVMADLEEFNFTNVKPSIVVSSVKMETG